MDNRDFWSYMRVAKPPDACPLFVPSMPAPRSRPVISWCWKYLRSLCRLCYVYFHDLILSSLLGYLTLDERLYVAVHENDLRKARQLLSHGATPSYIPLDYRTIIAHLLRENSKAQNYYMEASLIASILASDSMLYMAVSNNNYHLVQELINYHDYGRVAQHTEVVSLCLAVKRCYPKIVECLIDYGHINPNDRVQLGCKHCKACAEDAQRYQYPLYHACRENHLQLVRYLIELKQCDINQLTSSHETCLHGAILGAIENRFDSAVSSQQRFQIVRYLLARPECRTDLGLNPLCISLAHDNTHDYTSLLLLHKCNVNRLGWNRYERNRSQRRQSNQSLYSLDHPLNICLRALCQMHDSSATADHSCHKQHALKLIRDKANVYAMYEYGPSYPFLLAVQTGDVTIVQAILEHAQSYIRLDVMEPLMMATVKSYDEIVQALVNFGFDPNAVAIIRVDMMFENPAPNEVSSIEFLSYLDRYCTLPFQSTSSRTNSSRWQAFVQHSQQSTPFLALSRMPPWIFHPDRYDATMKTIENLFFRTPIDFTVRLNRDALHHALLNEHVPIVYYCLANYCPIQVLHHPIEFARSSLKHHFSYTLFHLVSTCARLTESNRVKRTLLDSYAKAILQIHTYDRSASMASVVAYMRLWFADEDFVNDLSLFEHLMLLPYVDDIIEGYNEQTLRALFGTYYQRVIERRPRAMPMRTLKQICRSKIRQSSEAYCERRHVNLLGVVFELRSLPRTLHAYLLYTEARSKLFVNHLLNGTAWNTVSWM